MMGVLVVLAGTSTPSDRVVCHAAAAAAAVVAVVACIDDGVNPLPRARAWEWVVVVMAGWWWWS
jgi:hypothetical protein